MIPLRLLWSAFAFWDTHHNKFTCALWWEQLLFTRRIPKVACSSIRPASSNCLSVCSVVTINLTGVPATLTMIG